MERGSSISKWLLLAGGVALFMIFGYPRLFGSNAADRQPLGPAMTAPVSRADEQFCELTGDRFAAKLTTHGAALRSARMTDAKYAISVAKPDTRIDLVPNDLIDSRLPLRTDLRVVGDAEQQVPFDELDYKLASSDGASCTFVYKDDATEVDKVVSLTGRPFELDVTLTVKNLADTAKKHRATFEQSAWRTKAETSGKLGRLPEWDTEVVLHTKDKTERHRPDDFDPKQFTKNKQFTSEAWLRAPGDGVWAATSSSYFTSTIIHVDGPATPFVEARIEDGWNVARFANKDDDPNYGRVYRSRLAYPEKELAQGESTTYETLAFFGPKERNVVAAIGGAGDANYKTTDLINMQVFLFGNLFTNTLGKVVVNYTYWLHDTLGSWGLAIILLTITVKLLVFPLSLTGLKNSVAMRRIKPQLDAINKKHKDDMMERNLATQEVMRREKVGSPMLGCLPALLQMPIWLTLYAALRSSVELYHTSFGPLIPDLSEPGLYFVMPVVLGGLSFLQQKLMQASMPQTDPTQARMMLFMMPVVFTVMNVFLPAGLGVYMLTNTCLGIVQQTFVERFIRSRLRQHQAGEIQVKVVATDDGGSSKKKLGAGKKDASAKKDGDASAATNEKSEDGSSKKKGFAANDAAIGKGTARARG